MVHSARKQLQLQPLDGYTPAVGLALAAFQETRQRTQEALQGLSPAVLDWTPAGWHNSIGSLLYHIALVEADWLYVEILETPFPAEAIALFPYDMRDEKGRLIVMQGVTLDEHLDRLAKMRAFFLEAMRSIDATEWVRVRSLPDYDVTPVWVLFHLMHHEAEHCGHIQFLRTLADQSNG